MGKFCPKCGAEVKEGFKFCLGCGAPMQEQATAPSQTTQVVVQQQTAPAAPPQQAVHPGYQPMQPKQTNMKLIFGIIGIVVAIVVIILVVFLVLGMGGGGGAQDFVGTWDVTMTGGLGDMEWTFNEDGSLDQTYDYGYGPSTTSTTWRVEDNKLYIGDDSGLDLPVDTGMSYQFSNGGNTVDLKYNYGGSEITVYTLTKSS